MARYRATIRGKSKTEASRLGNTDSGLTATVNGWNVGVQVYIQPNKEGRDEIIVYATGGSNAHAIPVKLATVTESPFVGKIGIEVNKRAKEAGNA